MDRIYLLDSHDNETGETFRTWEECHAWFYDQMGRWPTYNEKAAMRSGNSFTVGAREYSCMRQLKRSMLLAA